MRINLSVLALIFVLSFAVTSIKAQSVAVPLLKEEIGTFQNGTVTQTINQQLLNSILTTKVYNFFRNLSPQDISVESTQIRYFLNRGWQIYAEVEMDGNYIFFLKELSLENDELLMVETGYEEACISTSCQDVQFIEPQAGGCVCNTSGEVEYLFRTTHR